MNGAKQLIPYMDDCKMLEKAFTIAEYSYVDTIMEVHSYSTSLGIVKEIILDDGFEKITLLTNYDSAQERNMIVSNLNLIETGSFLESLDKLCFSQGEYIKFESEEEFLVYILSGRWALERELFTKDHSEENRSHLEEMLNQINDQIDVYIVEHDQGDGAYH